MMSPPTSLPSQGCQLIHPSVCSLVKLPGHVPPSVFTVFLHLLPSFQTCLYRVAAPPAYVPDLSLLCCCISCLRSRPVFTVLLHLLPTLQACLYCVAASPAYTLRSRPVFTVLLHLMPTFQTCLYCVAACPAYVPDLSVNCLFCLLQIRLYLALVFSGW